LLDDPLEHRPGVAALGRKMTLPHVRLLLGENVFEIAVALDAHRKLGGNVHRPGPLVAVLDEQPAARRPPPPPPPRSPPGPPPPSPLPPPAGPQLPLRPPPAAVAPGPLPPPGAAGPPHDDPPPPALWDAAPPL